MQSIRALGPFATAASLMMAFAAAEKADAAFSVIETKNFSFVPNGSENLTFAKFDDMGGTRILQGVEITVGYTKSGGSLAVDNDSAVGGTISLQHAINGDLTVVSGGVSLLDLAFDAIGSGLDAVNTLSSLGIGPSSGDSTTEFNNTGLSDYYLFSPETISVSDSGTINPLFQNSYIATTGSSTFSLNFSADQITGASGLGGLQQAFVVSNVEGFVTVEYIYDVVPEPSSMLLGVAGVLGLIARRRR